MSDLLCWNTDRWTTPEMEQSPCPLQNDGKLSREEHAAAPEHAGDKAAAGGTSTNKKY